jgi:hypothetical protein
MLFLSLFMSRESEHVCIAKWVFLPDESREIIISRPWITLIVLYGNYMYGTFADFALSLYFL